jgi:hypothetical protein
MCGRPLGFKSFEENLTGGSMSSITLFDGPPITETDGLPASASRLL